MTDDRMKKSDLQEGMVVELENGAYGEIGRLPYIEGLIIITNRHGRFIGGYVDLKLYTDDLIFKERTAWGRGCDIKNVYGSIELYRRGKYKEIEVAK